MKKVVVLDLASTDSECNLSKAIEGDRRRRLTRPETITSTGCINALNWSSDGTTLASGSDDTRVCLWKLGQEPDSIFADNADIVQRYPSLGLGLSAV